MASKYKVKRNKKGPIARLVPEAAQAFMARRILDGAGIASVLFGGFILLAIASYNRTDPSVNTAVSNNTGVQNWMGQKGASTADLLLQTVGLGGCVFGATFLIWGISLLKRRSLSPVWLRFVTMVFASVAAAAAFARIPSSDWLAQPHMGGSGGMKILQASADMISGGGGFSVMAWTWGIIAIVLSLLAFGTRFAELRWCGAIAVNLVTATGYFIYDSIVGFIDWVSHYSDDSHVKSKPKKPRKPIIPTLQSREDEEIFMETEEEEEEQDEEEESEEEEGEEEEYEEGEEEEEESEEEESEEEDEDENSGIRVNKPKPVAKAAKKNAKQKKFSLFDGGEWEIPTLDLLQDIGDQAAAQKIDQKALQMNASLLQNVLNDFNVKGEIVSINPGPVVTLYELEPAPGTKSSRVIGLADDIARSMSAVSVRAAVVPGRNVIGIEIPNKVRQTVYLREQLSTRDYEKTSAALPLILGKDIGGKPIIADLARMPHLLVAGTTGSGKSVAVNTMILSLLYRLPPEKCRFIMIDPKMLELSVYDDIPHLLSPVVTEPGKAVVALKWVVNEMEERYRAMSKLGVRNIDGYNNRLGEARKKGEVLMRKVQTGFDPETGKPVYEEQPLDLTDLPYIVVIVDEFADLMLVAGKDVEGAIQRLAQMARAAGIHLIMATQRPSVDVITGVIKANFPTRISFAVTSKIDSRTILGEGGAEQLLGQGDMLYMAPGGKITRVHGPFSSDADVENVVNFLKSQGEPSYIEDITEGDFEGEGGEGGGEEPCDELYDEAVALVAREQKASTSFIQRYLQIGYNRAARIIEEMERQGVVGKANHVGKREVLVGQR
ncbi:MAG: cell division protein FtsK [Micavibrio aeruginosavorus]|uniref:Cell division protein FtsK n=1 Tax=Micavibrio aeruginosavorus TaxID=349221 RepID=A0A2W4ZYD1_9BACT|nr:MAG: cell division protein FtsK [Micavibrio aeruginosavorus]